MARIPKNNKKMPRTFWGIAQIASLQTYKLLAKVLETQFTAKELGDIDTVEERGGVVINFGVVKVEWTRTITHSHKEKK